MATGKTASAPWQSRPVFISSTFKDMQAERDYLRHIVFPRLEEELRKGRLLLEPIDLRQGVETADLASEEARERLVLKVCLEEIQRSRPFLIVLLGDRYGWVPPEERMAAATQEVGFDADVHDKSVTALEIEFGILKQSPEQRRRSFFYFRDPLPYSEMPDSVRADYSDEFSTDPHTRARHGRLAALKQSLAHEPELAPRVHNYHACWEASKNEVAGLEAWSEMVYQHLLGELQAEIAAAASQPPQLWEDLERAALAEFIEHRRRDFTGRTQLLDDLTNLARSETPPGAVFAVASGVRWGAFVTGNPGSGKSAIFAELVTRLSADHSILLLTNAAGATPRGSQVEAMLERFIEELADALGITNPLPEKATPDDFDATFASLLGRVAVKRRVVVLLDALNQFDQTPRAQHLTWLRPKQWPANARLIATGLAGVPSEALSQWAGIEKRDVPPLTITDDDTDDVTAIAQAVWRRYHRQVNPAVLRVLKEKTLTDGSFAAANPLWLTLALEQINLLDADDFARAEREFPGSPSERLRAMLIDTAERMPPTVPELYELLLSQTERIFGVAPTRAFAAVIAVSRFGWRESDLLALIPAAARVLCPDSPVPQLDDLRLAALRRSFRAHLARRGLLEQLDFFHAQVRQAVEQWTLRDMTRVQKLHRVIADHLETLPSGDPLRESELMVHLIAGDDPARAARVYADMNSPLGAPTTETRVLAQHIIRGAIHSPNANAAWVVSLLTQPGLENFQIANICNRFNTDLQDAIANLAGVATRDALAKETHAALWRLADTVPNSPFTHRALSASFNLLGDFAMLRGSFLEAQHLYSKALRIRMSLAESEPLNSGCKSDVSQSQLKLGDAATAQGNLIEAQRYYEESLRNSSHLAESEGVSTARQRTLCELCDRLGNRAVSSGDFREAKRRFLECHQITKQLLDSAPYDKELQFNLSVSFEKLGELQLSEFNLAEAQWLAFESFRIRQRLVESDPTNTAWQRALSVSHDRLGDLAIAEASLSEAKRHFEAALQIMDTLAKTDPTNAEWQKDVALLRRRLSAESGALRRHVAIYTTLSLVLFTGWWWYGLFPTIAAIIPTVLLLFVWRQLNVRSAARKAGRW